MKQWKWPLLLALLGIAALAGVWMQRGAALVGGPATPLPAERQARVVYLSPSQAPELWTVSADGKDARQLTSTGGKVFDFNVSVDGSRIVYSVRNDQNGIDLWEMDREGSVPGLLLPCATDWCFSPAYSSDGSQIAYSRRQVSGIAGSDPGIPRLWLYDRSLQSTDVLFIDPNIAGVDPAWSPDGRFLALVDPVREGVWMVDFQTDEDFFVQGGQGVGFSWSPDSKQMLLTESGGAGDMPYVQINVLDVETHQTRVWLSEERIDYGAPAWSPDGTWVLVARRSIGGPDGRQLWLIKFDGSERQQVTDDPLANHAAYQWSPDGDQVVFQRLASGSSSSLPEVVLWHWRQGDQPNAQYQWIRLAEDAFQPRWIR